MAKDAVELIKEKLTKRDEDFRIYTYDNGYLIEVGGRDDDDNWATAKVFVSEIDDVAEVVKSILTEIEIVK